MCVRPTYRSRWAGGATFPNRAQRNGEIGRSSAEPRPVSAHVRTDSRMKCLVPGPAHPSSTAAFIDPKRESLAEIAQVQTLHHPDQPKLPSPPSQSQPLSRNRSAQHPSIVRNTAYGLPHRLSIIQIVQFSPSTALTFRQTGTGTQLTPALRALPAPSPLGTTVEVRRARSVTGREEQALRRRQDPVGRTMYAAITHRHPRNRSGITSRSRD